MQIVNTEVKEYLELNFKNVRQTEKGFRINVEQLDKTDLENQIFELKELIKQKQL